MEMMDIGVCLDYIDEFTDFMKPKKEKKKRKATQADFDRF